MWQDLLKIYLNLDKGMIFTLKQVFSHPGEAAREYVSGKRVQYIKPLTFITIASAAAKASMHQYDALFSEWFQVQKIPEALVVTVVSGAILSRWFIKDSSFNFWERLTLQMFISFGALVVIAGAGFVLPQHIFGWLCLALPVLFTWFQAIGYWQFFQLWNNPKKMTMAAIAAGLATIVGLGIIDWH